MVDTKTESRALAVIESKAKSSSPDSIGYKIWIDNWKEQNK